MVAQEATNRQVGTRLGISERTVGHRVVRILRKLGLASRAQIALPGRPNGVRPRSA